MQNKKNDGDQKGPQQHAEGQQGEKTHGKFLEEIHSKSGGDDADRQAEGATKDGVDVFGKPIEGHHRLHEDREQHDEGEKNSEANRLRR